MWLGICLALTPVHQLRRAGTKPARSPVVAAEQGEAYAEGGFALAYGKPAPCLCRA